MKFITILILLISSGFFNFIIIDSNDQVQNLPFKSNTHLYKLIKNFSQKELGMPLYFQIPTPKDTSGQDTITYYCLYVWPKNKWLDLKEDISQNYVYFGQERPDSLIRFYQDSGYSVYLETIKGNQVAKGDSQSVPSDPNFYKNLTFDDLVTIFHEGFHYHVTHQKARPEGVSSLENRSIEESAANIVGLMAAKMFVEKYCSKTNLLAQARMTIAFWDNWAEVVNFWYDSLKSIYFSDLSDSLKLVEKNKTIKACQEELMFEPEIVEALLANYHLYTSYYFYFRETWTFINNPKKSIEVFLEFIRKHP